MKASLDTNVIIHMYRAGLQNILFDFFEEGVFVYEQIRTVELENHGQDILELVDQDITLGKIKVYTSAKLKEQSVLKIFDHNVRENRILYRTSDLGEVYAMSLAQTLGIYSLVTDDIKQGGPYMSLLQLDYDVTPFTFSEILILRYLLGVANVDQTIHDFDKINDASDLHWSFKSQIKKFIRRFWKDPYKDEDKLWMADLVKQNNIKVKSKFEILADKISQNI